MQAHKTINVTIFGATGFSGSLVAEHLVTRYGGDMCIALAGRDSKKLEALADRFGPGCPLVIEANARDPKTLMRLAERSDIVVSTVGPYHEHGDALVAACAEAGADYCDLSAEPDWIRRMIERHGAEAKRSGARLLFSCGFDSIPSEIGVIALQQAAKKRFGRPLTRVAYRLAAQNPPLSGGTVASLRGNQQRAERDPAVAALLADPFSLTPGFRGPATASQPVSFDPVIGQWTVPFLMAYINVPNVHRAHALLGHPWGADFLYDERMARNRLRRGGARRTEQRG